KSARGLAHSKTLARFTWPGSEYKVSGLWGALRFSLPSKFAFGFLDRQVVDAGVAAFHVTEFVKFPIFVAVSAIPLARVIVVFVFDADRDAIAGESPQFLLQPVIELAVPFAAEKFHDLLATVDEFGAIAPFGVLGIPLRNAFGVAAVPGIFRGLYLLAG